MEMKIAKKLFLTLFLMLLVGFLHDVILPVIEPQIAVTQAEDSMASYTNLHSYRWLMDYYWVLEILIPVLFFWKDVYKFIRSDKNEN